MKTKITLLALMFATISIGQQSTLMERLPIFDNFEMAELEVLSMLPDYSHLRTNTLRSANGDTIYVDEKATGQNDGSSWSDAYSDLGQAISMAQSGDQLWLAAGLYKPQIVNTPTDSNFFFIDKPLEIYGGFTGVEHTLDERDWEANPTVISGDINGDDTDDDFENNKSDNTIRLFHIVSTDVLIDGLEISYGRTRMGFDPSIHPSPINFSGGAILDQGSSTISNCVFRQNSAHQGGAIYSGINTGIELRNCRLEHNHAAYWVGGLHIGSQNATISDCVFESNLVEQGGGGAMTIVQNLLTVFDSTTVLIENCEFRSNKAPSGAGLAFNNWADQSKIQVNNCQFIENESTVFGGAFLYQSFGNRSYVEFDNCQFSSNQATNGGAIFNVTPPTSTPADRESWLSILNSTFEFNTAQTDGGAIYNRADSDTLNFFMDGCIIRNNFTFTENPGNGGAGILNAGVGNGIMMFYDIRNTLFEANNSSGISGGLWNSAVTPDQGTKGRVINCDFIENSAQYCCGGLGAAFDDGIYESCSFIDNYTEGSHPGLVGGGGAGFVLNRSIEIINSVFQSNISIKNGAALYISVDGEYRLENLDIRSHTSDAVFIDTKADLINNTLRDNEIGLFSGSQADVSLQNNVFDNSLNRAGTGVLISNGGNISSDMSMTSVLTSGGAYEDRNDQSPLLESDGVPSANSPCIDAGNPENVTTNTDVLGNQRVQGNGIDIGAYESPFVVAVEDAVWDPSIFNVYPNPVDKQMRLEINISDFGSFDIQVFDAQGRRMLLERNNSTPLLELGHLASGHYFTIVSGENGSYGAKFIKK